MKFLLIPVEVKARAFESRLLLSCFAAEEGFGVLFGDSRSLYPNLNKLPKGVIFAKSISRHEYPALKRRVDNGFKIACLDEEGLASNGRKFVFLNQRISSKTLGLSSIFFTWGIDESELIIKNFPKFKQKIKVVGNPRIDLWVSDFKKIYKKQSLKYKKKFGEYILLPSNFAFKTAAGPSSRLKQAKKQGALKNEEMKKNFFSYREYRKKSFYAHISLIKKLAHRFEDTNFVIRPHIAEDRDAWNEFKSFSNVKIINKGPITPWQLGCKMTIHNNCTTGLEAYLLGKPVISYVPFEHPEGGNHISNGVSLRAKTPDEVINVCRNILEDPMFFKRNLKIWPNFEKIISIDDKKLACEKIVTHLNNLDLHEYQTDDFSIPQIKDFIKGNIRFAKKVLSKTKLFKYKYSKRFQKFPGSSLYEVKDLVNKFRQISGKFENIKVTKIANNLYYIRKQ